MRIMIGDAVRIGVMRWPCCLDRWLWNTRFNDLKSKRERYKKIEFFLFVFCDYLNLWLFRQVLQLINLHNTFLLQ